MKVLVDTNIVLDVLLQRYPFFDYSRVIFELIEQKRITGCISSSAFTDIFYLTNKEIKNAETVYKAADKLSFVFIIAPVFESTIKSALALRWKDFEDAVQYMTAKENSVDYIITRNTDDYKSPEISCVNPEGFLAHFKAIEAAEKKQ
jgi:predicted nucleic acid-binding protein